MVQVLKIGKNASQISELKRARNNKRLELSALVNGILANRNKREIAEEIRDYWRTIKEEKGIEGLEAIVRLAAKRRMLHPELAKEVSQELIRRKDQIKNLESEDDPDPVVSTKERATQILNEILRSGLAA